MIRREIPADFAEHAHEPLSALCLRYKTNKGCAARWRREIGVVPKPVVACPRRIAPADFMQRQEGRTTRDLEKLFACSNAVLTRWFREHGIYRKAERRAKAVKPPKKPVVKVSHRANHLQVVAVTKTVRDGSPAGLAADYLRRFSAVVRCNRDGRYDPQGSFWRRGSTVLTPDEVVARAARLGWQAESMAA